jgi:hypothetical protein
MKNLVELQRERDLLRASLQVKVKQNNFDNEFMLKSELLKRKDKEFFSLVKRQNVQVSKFGRLVK